MKKRWIVALAIALLVLFAVRPRQRPTADIPAVSTPAPPAVASATASTPDASTSPGFTPPSSKGTPASVSPPVQTEASLPPATSPAPQPIPPLAELRDEIDNVQFALRDFRSVLGENPVGNNAEITKALTGDNLKQVKIPIPQGSSVNANGEMCDRWGTPYFFHQLSGKQMEIHSAGPDHQMGTSDDLVVK